MSATTSRSELGATSPQTLTAALDRIRFDEIAELAERAASYWQSIALAADRGERLTVETHCRQVAVVTRETFSIVKSLGSEAADQ
jgi:hypothetical protein